MSVHPEESLARRPRGNPTPDEARPRSPRRSHDPFAVPVALARAIATAVAELEAADVRDVAGGRDVDRRLREAVTPHLTRTGRTGRVVALVRIACAQLAVGDVELGLPALRDARDLLR